MGLACVQTSPVPQEKSGLGLAFPQGASISFLVIGQVRQYIVDKIIRYPLVEQENLKQFILIILTKTL